MMARTLRHDAMRRRDEAIKARSADKRIECGCHRECTIYAHRCDNPCQWPNCLTDEEHKQLLVELANKL